MTSDNRPRKVPTVVEQDPQTEGVGCSVSLGAALGSSSSLSLS